MPIKKAKGRTHKVDYRVMIKLADAIQHNASVSESCAFVGISRQLYYYYFNTNSVFREKMTTAKNNQDKLVMSFLTTW